MRRLTLLLLLAPLAGCAGYAADYVRPRPSLIAGELARYNFDTDQARCVGDRLAAALSVWQTRQLTDVAATGTRIDGSALTPRDFVAVSSRVTDTRVPEAVTAAAEACSIGDSGAAGGIDTSTAPAASDSAPPASDGAPPAPDGAPPAQVAWVNLGAAASGQAIAVEAASVRREGATRRAWFRLTNPGPGGASPVAYLLRIDCSARTINPMAFRQYGPDGAVLAQRDYGPQGEGAIAVEAGTVMELAFLSLCT